MSSWIHSIRSAAVAEPEFFRKELIRARRGFKWSGWRIRNNHSSSEMIWPEIPDFNSAVPDIVLQYCYTWSLLRQIRIQDASCLTPEQQEWNRAAKVLPGLKYQFDPPVTSWSVPAVNTLGMDYEPQQEFRTGRYLGLSSRGQHLFLGAPVEESSVALQRMPDEFRLRVFGVFMVGGSKATIVNEQKVNEQ